MWLEAPMPPDAYETLPGVLRARAMSSSTVFTGSRSVQVSQQLLDGVQPRRVRRPVVDEHNPFARDVVLALVRSVRPRSVLHVDDVFGSTVLNHFRADQAQSVIRVLRRFESVVCRAGIE